jgi:N-acetylglucosaminyldiphosphoundecaprenol N-acetyl-beta-D-mannosaminyltransferase
MACTETLPSTTFDTPVPAPLPTVRVMGLDLARITTSQTLDYLDSLVQLRRPAYFITANLNYAMLTAHDQRLRSVNEQAALIVADGMPLVWGARFSGAPVPGRVTGADLTPALCARAAEQGHSVFILGAEPSVARAAAARLSSRYPGLWVAGTESPDLATLSPQEHDELLARIRAAQPQLVLVAFGQPKGEVWIANHYRALGPAVCVQVGAAIDFAAGNASRAPRWMQRTGLEWAFRLGREPLRLGRRYLANGIFLCRCAAVGALSALRQAVRRRLA